MPLPALKTLALLATLLLGLSGCGGGGGGDTGVDVTGAGQKGPFLSGATVTAYAMNSDGSRNGKSIQVTAGDNGSYSLHTNWSGPTELVISGDAYNEADGSTITNVSLSAVVDVTERQSISTNMAPQRFMWISG